MKIKNVKTGNEFIVTEELWNDILRSKNRSSQFEIVSDIIENETVIENTISDNITQSDIVEKVSKPKTKRKSK